MKNCEYYINIAENVFYKNNAIFAEERLDDSKYRTVAELRNYIFSNNCLTFFCEQNNGKYYFLTEAEQEIIKNSWDTEFSNNISFEKEEGDLLKNYPKDYFYFFDLWLSIKGIPIIIFYRHH